MVVMPVQHFISAVCQHCHRLFNPPLCPTIGCDERAKAKTKTVPAICGKRRTVMHACTAQGNKKHQKYNNLQQVRSTGRYVQGKQTPRACMAWPGSFHILARLAVAYGPKPICKSGWPRPADMCRRGKNNWPTCTADLGTSQPMCRVANGLMTSLLTTESYCA